MPFGPNNAPAFYTCMMGNFRDEWQLLFLQSLQAMTEIGQQPITIRNTDEIYLGDKRIYSGTKVIIDDILLWSTNLDLVLLLFECVCKVFLKYRVSFRLDKCEFLKERVEYVGHDLTPNGNCPAASKFDLITDWVVPVHSQQLHSFVSLLNFYSKFEPYFEIKVKPLRRLYRKYFKKDIPTAAWTPELIALFKELKTCITSSPVLARFDPDKPTFLKTDWSAYGMGYILMQPGDDDDSHAATILLRTTGECLFDLTPEGPRLRPIRFGSRGCTDRERYYHSFVGESACGRWAIGQNKRFLWGSHFYWMCDCKAAEEIVDYEGSIAMICRWAQELLGYDFTVIHRKASMMIDVDGLSRRFGKRIARHLMIAAILTEKDKALRPLAYTHSIKQAPDPTRTNVGVFEDGISAPILLNHGIIKDIEVYQDHVEPDLMDVTHQNTFSTSPILLHSHIKNESVTSSKATESESVMFQAVDALIIHWLCIDDVTGSMLAWQRNGTPPPLIWNIQHIFTNRENSSIFQCIHPSDKFSITALTVSTYPVLDSIHGFDICFIPHCNGNAVEWTCNIAQLISTIAITNPNLVQATGWIRTDYCPPQVESAVVTALHSSLPSHWEFTIHHYNTAKFGDSVSANRTSFQFYDASHQISNHGE